MDGKNAIPIPSVEFLESLLMYVPENGYLLWREGAARHLSAGARAGSLQKDGRRKVAIKRKTYTASRVIWKLVHGFDPPDEVDHINGDCGDDRLGNLRLATAAENSRNTKLSRNSTSGFKGVSWHKPTGKWRASITKNRKIRWLGLFATAREAHRAYCHAAIDLHGEFASFVARGMSR